MANIDKITLRGVNYSIIDSSVPSYVKGITQTDITNWNNKPDSFTETDPTVPSYIKGITEEDIEYWNYKVSYDNAEKTSVTLQTLNIKTSKAAPSHDPGINFNVDNKIFTGSHLKSTVSGNNTDYKFTREVNGDVAITNDITKAINSYVISASYLQSFTETDPTVPTHVKSITQQNINDWNNKLSAETQLSKGTTTGSGNAVTDISVSNHQITLTKGSTFLTAHQDIKTINNQTITGTGNVTINELPTVSSSDNGKVLQVVNGQWQLVTPLHLYSGTGAPDNSQGNNGDLYMQI